MNAKCTIKAPFFEIGPKSYLYGDEILDLAKAADAAGTAKEKILEGLDAIEAVLEEE